MYALNIKIHKGTRSVLFSSVILAHLTIRYIHVHTSEIDHTRSQRQNSSLNMVNITVITSVVL